MDIKKELALLREAVTIGTLPVLPKEIRIIEKDGRIREEKVWIPAAKMFGLKEEDNENAYDHDQADSMQKEQATLASKMFVQLIWSNLEGSEKLKEFQEDTKDRRELSDLKTPAERIAWGSKAMAYAQLESLQMEEYMTSVKLLHDEHIGMHLRKKPEGAIKGEK